MSERKEWRVRRVTWIGVVLGALLAAAVIQLLATRQTVRGGDPTAVSNFMDTVFCGGEAPPYGVANSDAAAPAADASVDAQAGGEPQVAVAVGCGPKADAR